MKYLTYIKRKFIKAFNKEISLIIYSVLTAIVIWFLISTTLYPSASKTINNITLVTNINKELAGDLTLVSCDVEKVNVQIVGKRTEIGNLENDNLVAKIVTDNITSSGTKTVSIEVENEDGIEFEVKSIDPPTATIVLDKIETREFTVTPEIPNITFANGKTINRDDFSCEPSVIKITGPSAQLDKIAECKAVSNRTAELDSSYILQSDEIKLYTEDGAVFDTSNLQFDTENITINIPVMTQKTVDLSVSIRNAPSNFDKDFLKFSMSTDNITLAVANSSTEIPDPFEIGKIILSDIDIGYSNTFTVEMKDGYINQSNLEAVTVTLENDNLAKKDVVVSDISISNPQANYDYEIIAQNITVTVIGPEDVIEDITGNDLVADVNLLNETINSDSFNHVVTISCPTYDNVWAFGTYKVTVNRTEKTATTSTTVSTELEE